MTIKGILNITDHRPWSIPEEPWRYYQEWNNAIFLHWKVDYDKLKKLIPRDLEIDLFDGEPWISIVAFTMQKIRHRALPSFTPISNFHEINIRTYVKKHNKTGVYFLSIEGGNQLSCLVARTLSELPYRYSTIKRQENIYNSYNKPFKDKLKITYEVGPKLNEKTKLDIWLTERYALFQDTKTSINEFEIHHTEWPVNNLTIKNLEVGYPRFESFLSNLPDITQYSSGVKVVAWDKNKHKRMDCKS